MKQNIKDLPAFGLMLLIPFVNQFYVALNNDDRGVHSLITDIDRAIPFVKAFIIPYVSWYVFIFLCLGYFFLKERKLYYKTLASLLIGLFACYTVYYFFQTTIMPIRPEITGKDWLSRLIQVVYSKDNPFNCFPSIHCFTSFLIMRAIHHSTSCSRLSRLFIYGLGSTIVLSTLFMKQHVVLDVVAAAILAHSVFMAITFVEGKLENVWRKRQSLSWMMKKRFES